MSPDTNPEPTTQGPLAVTRRRVLRWLGLAAGFVLAGCGALGCALGRGRRRAVAWDELQAKLAGSVVPREAAGYESARLSMVWNAFKPSRHPEAIVHVASVADVQQCVRFARQHGLRVAVRGGGHNWNGAPLRDGGLLLDLTRLNAVAIDPAARTASVEPVVNNRDLARQLAAHGLAFPVGHCPTVTLSGYLLGGGFGFNAGAWGVACFNVTAMEIVTADGELVRASESENTELFWAARGAGSGFFGVVTRYHLKLYPLPSHIRSSTLLFPLERAREVAAWLAATAPKLPSIVECTLLYVQSPPPVAAKSERACVVSAVAYAGSSAEAEAALAPIAACPLSDCLLKELNAGATFESLFDEMDRQLPHGRRYAVDTFWLDGDPVTLLGEAARQFARTPSQDSMMLALVMPPPPADAPPMPDCAFSMVGPVYVGCYAAWREAAGDEANIQWLRDAGAALRSATIGHYLGEVDLTADDSRASRSFAKPHWERLQALRAEFDPDGVFHPYLGPRG